MSVRIPHLEPESLELGTDADCTFHISDADIKGVCMITLSDGGGFTGFLMSYDEWPVIREKIDNFIRVRGSDRK